MRCIGPWRKSCLEHNNRREADRFLGLLGICRKAGGVLCGAPAVYTALHSKRPPLLVLAAADASPATQKKLCSQCDYYEVPLLVTAFSMETLSHTVGKSHATAALGITDARFSGELERLYSLIKSSGKDAPADTGTGI